MHPCASYPRLFNLVTIILPTHQHAAGEETVQLASAATDTPTNPRLQPLIRWEHVSAFAGKCWGKPTRGIITLLAPLTPLSPHCSRSRNTSTPPVRDKTIKKAAGRGEKVIGSRMITLKSVLLAPVYTEMTCRLIYSCKAIWIKEAISSVGDTCPPQRHL